MGKSSKKSATKVGAAPVAVPKSQIIGKRGAEDEIEKAVSAKKHKLESDETVLAKQKADEEQPKEAAIGSSDDSDFGTPPKEKPVANKQPAANNGSAAVRKTPAADSAETSESDPDDDAKPDCAVNNVAKKDPSSRDSCERDSYLSEEENVAKVAPAAAPEGKVESNESESDEEKDSSDSHDSHEEPEADKPKDTDVEMVDAEKSSASTFQKTPKTPATPEAIVSKTLYVGNLSFSVKEPDVREFFKNAGELVDVRFSINADGKFRGFGHVEFATVEAAQKAMELNNQELLGRPVKLDYARERSALTPQSRVQGQTAFVRGFNTSLGEDEIRSAVQEHFGSCGEITRISIRQDYESGGVNKMACMDFANRSGLEAALQKNDSDLGGGFYLKVQEAKSRGDSAGGGFDRGGKSGGGRGGRDGGRFRGRGGRGGRKGGRGSTPNKSTVSSGKKKKTFWDD